MIVTDDPGLGFSLPHHKIHAKIRKTITGKIFGGKKKDPPKLKAWKGAVPYAAPAGSVWLSHKGKPVLFKPKGGREKKLVKAALKKIGQAFAAGAQISPTFTPQTTAPGALPAEYIPPGLPAAPAAPVTAAPMAPTFADPYGFSFTPMMQPAQPYGYPQQPAPPYGYQPQIQYQPGPSMVPGVQLAPPGDPFDVMDAQVPDDTDAYEVYSSLYDADSEDEELSGVMTDYMRQKWDEAVAWLQAKAGEFLGMKAKLMGSQRKVTAALERARSGGFPSATVRALSDTAGKLQQALENQRSLEGQVINKMREVGLSEPAGAGLGVLPLIPIAITAASAAALGLVVAKVVSHMRSSADLNRMADMVTKGIISGAEAEALMRAGGGGDLLGLGNLKPIAMLALGVAALIAAPKLLQVFTGK